MNDAGWSLLQYLTILLITYNSKFCSDLNVRMAYNTSFTNINSFFNFFPHFGGISVNGILDSGHPEPRLEINSLPPC